MYRIVAGVAQQGGEQCVTQPIGEIGPGSSYGDVVEGFDVPVGFDDEFTNKNTAFMTWKPAAPRSTPRGHRWVPDPGKPG